MHVDEAVMRIRKYVLYGDRHDLFGILLAIPQGELVAALIHAASKLNELDPDMTRNLRAKLMSYKAKDNSWEWARSNFMPGRCYTIHRHGVQFYVFRERCRWVAMAGLARLGSCVNGSTIMEVSVPTFHPAHKKFDHEVLFELCASWAGEPGVFHRCKTDAPVRPWKVNGVAHAHLT